MTLFKKHKSNVFTSMEYLPDELYKHIVSFLKPKPTLANKYKYSIIWCNKCGDLLSDGDWFINMTYGSTFMVYTCKLCKYDNLYFEEDHWAILLDYISSNDTLESSHNRNCNSLTKYRLS